MAKKDKKEGEKTDLSTNLSTISMSIHKQPRSVTTYLILDIVLNDTTGTTPTIAFVVTELNF